MKRFTLLIIAICFLTSCTSLQKKTLNKSASEPPKLLKPEVKKIWIPPEIRNGGSEWVEGHYLYRIDKETTWSR